MGRPESTPRYTVEQYLKIERSVQDRYEFLDGQIRAMAGESGEHGDITANIMISLGSQLKGKPCRARTKDTKVRSGPTLKAGETSKCLYSYPDIVVICGEPDYLDDKRDVILNPAVIVEVLSESTEAFDRGEKFERFRDWNETLSDYLLVSQDKPQIEHFTRQSDGSWSFQETIGLDNSISISSIQCTLRLDDVYDRVLFRAL
ncbi:MAG: Uma2 family endonuclease [Planctomycetes bacterium]|nr:Uma2 family endonuclease [Planctomycetota bacterium]